MPFYQVYHSCTLSDEQKQVLASRITSLHCEAFNTPKFFVHVRFFPEKNEDNTYFVAGRPHSSTSNRIIGLVRTSASRSKKDFDELAKDIEYNWYNVLGVEIPEDSNIWTSENEKKRLIMVTFTPMIALREASMTIPEAGHDQEWLEEQLPFIHSMANKHVPGFSDLSDEITSKMDKMDSQ
jgi:phenylpyruvate tautomerase PptA (4-oxalocrotonate tautomerase family)